MHELHVTDRRMRKQRRVKQPDRRNCVTKLHEKINRGPELLSFIYGIQVCIIERNIFFQITPRFK